MVIYAEHGKALLSPFIKASRPQGRPMGCGIERVEEAKAPR
jgi:hypothetical protein